MVYNLQQIEENTLTSIFIQQVISYFLLFLNKFRLKYQFTISMQKSMKNSDQKLHKIFANVNKTRTTHDSSGNPRNFGQFQAKVVCYLSGIN